MADEEIIEGGAAEGAEPGGASFEGAEFVPDAPVKPKPDVYSAILILAFIAFLTGIILVGNELHESYDVQFWVFSKK